MIRRLLEVLVAPVGLIVVVLGSILGGLATPTEAAAVGAFGAMLLTARKVDPASSGPAMIAVLAIRRLTGAARDGRSAARPHRRRRDGSGRHRGGFHAARGCRLWDLRRHRDDRARQDPGSRAGVHH